MLLLSESGRTLLPWRSAERRRSVMSRPTMRAWIVLGASNACMDSMPASRGQLSGGGTCLCAAPSLPSSRLRWRLFISLAAADRVASGWIVMAGEVISSPAVRPRCLLSPACRWRRPPGSSWACRARLSSTLSRSASDTPGDMAAQDQYQHGADLVLGYPGGDLLVGGHLVDSHHGGRHDVPDPVVRSAVVLLLPAVGMRTGGRRGGCSRPLR